MGRRRGRRGREGGERGGGGGRERGRKREGRDVVLTPTTMVGRVSVKLNDRMAVGTSWALAWLAGPSGSPPNGGLMR